MDPFPYAFSPKRPARREFVRVLARISTRLAKLEKQPEGNVETVHEIRTLIKLLRTLLWFAKPAFPPTTSAYAKVEFKKAAGLLSRRRDATAIQATLKDLADEATAPEQRQAVERATRLLASRRLETNNGAVSPHPEREAIVLVQKTIRHLTHAASAAMSWKSPDKRLAKARVRTVAAQETAKKNPTPIHLHEWRKKAKRLLYLLQVLHAAPKKKTKRAIKRIDKLQHRLGDHHDSVVLEERLTRGFPAQSARPAFKPVFELLAARERRLRKKAEKVARHD
jgi:CHAD domain-containing protein